MPDIHQDRYWTERQTQGFLSRVLDAPDLEVPHPLISLVDLWIFVFVPPPPLLNSPRPSLVDYCSFSSSMIYSRLSDCSVRRFFFVTRSTMAALL